MTDIADLGGEFALIERITRGRTGDPAAGVLLGVGDDCAVIDVGVLAGPQAGPSHCSGQVLLVTTDMLVEEDHFSLRWATPHQVGIKAAEANLSDIAAMAGQPRWAFVSLALRPGIDAEMVAALYDGLAASLQRWKVPLVGGDTTHGPALVINVTLLGSAARDQVRRRGDAQLGDQIAVSGDLGKSWAGLELLRAGRGAEGNTTAYLEPRCRLDLLPLLGPRVHAMIDVSDGLASEVRHICARSRTGALLFKERIPLAPDTRHAADLLGKDPYQWALSGGEDFELVFTAAPAAMAELTASAGADVTVVGEVIDAEAGLWLVDDRGRRTPLPGGYDHFGGELR